MIFFYKLGASSIIAKAVDIFICGTLLILYIEELMYCWCFFNELRKRYQIRGYAKQLNGV